MQRVSTFAKCYSLLSAKCQLVPLDTIRQNLIHTALRLSNKFGREIHFKKKVYFDMNVYTLIVSLFGFISTFENDGNVPSDAFPYIYIYMYNHA